jgi:hypothetical protein
MCTCRGMREQCAVVVDGGTMQGMEGQCRGCSVGCPAYVSCMQCGHCRGQCRRKMQGGDAGGRCRKMQGEDARALALGCESPAGRPLRVRRLGRGAATPSHVTSRSRRGGPCVSMCVCVYVCVPYMYAVCAYLITRSRRGAGAACICLAGAGERPCRACRRWRTSRRRVTCAAEESSRMRIDNSDVWVGNSAT